MSQSPPVPPPIHAATPAPGGYLKPHRGGSVLATGILGLTVCFICGIVAWVMAANDLREMDAGRMDPAGRANTRAGRTCGIISVATTLVALAIGLVWMLVVIGMYT